MYVKRNFVECMSDMIRETSESTKRQDNLKEADR